MNGSDGSLFRVPKVAPWDGCAACLFAILMQACHIGSSRYAMRVGRVLAFLVEAGCKQTGCGGQ